MYSELPWPNVESTRPPTSDPFELRIPGYTVHVHPTGNGIHDVVLRFPVLSETSPDGEWVLIIIVGFQGF